METIIDALVDLPSPALKTRLAATESALVAAKSEREEAAKRLETAKAKHRDLLNSQVVYSRLAGTRNIEPGLSKIRQKSCFRSPKSVLRTGNAGTSC